MKSLNVLPSTVQCPLRGQLPGNEISVMRCTQTNESEPHRCAQYGCLNYLGAAAVLALAGVETPIEVC